VRIDESVSESACDEEEAPRMAPPFAIPPGPRCGSKLGVEDSSSSGSADLHRHRL